MRGQPSIYLASRSPRRRELLKQIGVVYCLIDVAIDERKQPFESPEQYVRRIAEEKAKVGADKMILDETLPVLAADTCVVIHGAILGKPRDREQGIGMLRQLSNNTHEVYTAVTLGVQSFETRLSISHVSFRALNDVEIAAYWETGEPADKAGGYAIQGIGAQFIQRLEGSFSGVMGLPLYETAELLRHNGIELLSRDE
jgi:septum formation protein